jgi:hypothetical protein
MHAVEQLLQLLRMMTPSCCDEQRCCAERCFCCCSWCREPVYSSWWRELVGRGLLLLREMALTYLPYEA